jgi:flavin-dependent dehydrogenase
MSETAAKRVPVIEISGAGPAGLAAALSVVHSGREACVYERRSDVGKRFHGDFQGLENWTTDIDVLEELGSLGIEAGFEHTPFYEVTCFSPDGTSHEFRSEKPLFYLIRRGSKAGCLDTALKQQALDAGVEIRFGESLHHLPSGGIVTQGPRRADAIAAGYLFETDMADGAYAAISDRLAPKGYAYLLICKGRGTLASCLFDDFHNERRYLERSVEFFTEKLGVTMNNPRRFGGSGNFSLPRTARKGNILYAGESAGFQDPLFGFGIRWALISGAEAGRALADNDPARYETVWKQRLRAYHQTAATNRWFYDRMGDRGYAAALRKCRPGQDARRWMKNAYAPRLWKRAWYYAVASRRHTPLLKVHEDCDCTWCRCERHMKTADNNT